MILLNCFLVLPYLKYLRHALLGKNRRDSSKHKYYIVSPRVIIKAIIIIHILGLTSQSVCKIIQSANFPFNSLTPLTLHFPVHQTCKFIFFGTLICSIVLQIRRAIFLFLKSGRAQLQASGFESDIEGRFQNEETSDLGKSRKKNWKRNGNNPWELRPLWRAADCGAKGPPLTALPGILWVFATLYRHPSLSRPSSISPSLSTYSTSWISNTTVSDRVVNNSEHGS